MNIDELVNETQIEKQGFIKHTEYKDLSRIYVNLETNALLYVKYYGENFKISLYKEIR